MIERLTLQRHHLIIGGVLALVTLGAYWMLGPRPVLVEVAAVTEQPFTEIVEEDGRTRVRDRFVVSAPLSGRVPRFTLRAGDTVKTGQTIAMVAPNVSPLLDPRVRQELEERVGAAQAALDEATALHERANVLLTRARSDLARTTQLRARGVNTVAQLEHDTSTFQAAERDVAAAELRHHAAEHALDQARAALKRSGETEGTEQFPVSAPIDGRVLKVIQESEGAVSLGAPLLELGDPADLEVVVDVLTTDAARIREGAKVLLERWGGPTPLQARVRRVEPSGFTKISALGVEEQRVWIVIDITSPRELWTALGDGYRVDVKIIVDQIEKAVVVPIGALFRRGDAWQVFVVDGGRARLKSVKVLRRSGRLAAIAEGLRPGESVVLYPPSALKEGSAVRVP
ncbi:MAG TPA: efflux RND transporter periplasmic adaptor subunit [Hyphomicrobiaceae bacterium]|jgi:HlyD family secretion protein|nr:efflux RND transporter periplasmic adaptor subunit [Hyphomicrobiaceae bacterium]